MMVAVTNQFRAYQCVKPTLIINKYFVRSFVDIFWIVNVLNHVPAVINIHELVTPANTKYRQCWRTLVEKSFCKHESEISVSKSDGTFVFLAIIFWVNVSAASNYQTV